MVTMREYTTEFRQSAVNLVLVEGLSARKAAFTAVRSGAKPN